VSTSGSPRVQLFHAVTHGIRITVRPSFAPEHSDPRAQRYAFVYRIRIENTGRVTAQLRWRHWYIHDPVGGDSEVQGEGVVGEMPTLERGQVHEYQSFCILQGPTGAMHGYYVFLLEDGSEIRVAIPRFEFRA